MSTVQRKVIFHLSSHIAIDPEHRYSNEGERANEKIYDEFEFKKNLYCGPLWPRGSVLCLRPLRLELQILRILTSLIETMGSS